MNSYEKQNQAIRKIGADFLNWIESAPKHGNLLRKIAEAFGYVAHWELENLDSKNLDLHPPKQAFRLEIRSSKSIELEDDLRDVYEALIRYGVFIRDVRGKSQRSAVVPRLYLRRLLIPTFNLTFNKRDNVGVEIEEFKLLLSNPEEFKEKMIQKKRRSFRNRKQIELPYDKE